MKRTLALIICLFLIVAATVVSWQHRNSPSVNTTMPEASPTPPQPSPAAETVTVGGQTVAYEIFQAKPSQISLIPNFSERKNSEELVTEHACVRGVNGGFYTPSYAPLGLFVVDGEEFGRQSSSLLVNGFLGLRRDAAPFIGTTIPDGNHRFILQTGPLLFSNGNPLRLAINNDEHARRMTAALSDAGEFIFIALYTPESVFDGPLLSDVPSVLAAISAKESLSFSEAINLDGGSASAFYSGKQTLTELTPIGSFFCVKP